MMNPSPLGLQRLDIYFFQVAMTEIFNIVKRKSSKAAQHHIYINCIQFSYSLFYSRLILAFKMSTDSFIIYHQGANNASYHTYDPFIYSRLIHVHVD